jgi:DNA-binding MarR family transcriptional regulator
MKKTVEEQLLEQIVKAPRAIRRAQVEARFEEAEKKGFIFAIPRPAFARDRILEALEDCGGSAKAKELAKELEVSPAAISDFVSRLENDGYVERKVDENDKRATKVSLTELGTARAAELIDDKKERYDKIFKALTEKERAQLLKLLEKITAEDEEEE